MHSVRDIGQLDAKTTWESFTGRRVGGCLSRPDKRGRHDHDPDNGHTVTVTAGCHS